jgi:hypothetical protein
MPVKNLALAAVTAAALFTATAASAQTRTWVSGVGDDLNPCSRTAPCKTFAGAINKTATGGEINCLDPGGFGAVTITKSITILCDNTEGGIAAAGTNGVIVNAPTNSVVVLSGLDIDGFASGLNAVRFIAGGTLHVRNTTIRNFNAATANNGHGITFAPTAPAKLVLDNVDIQNCGTGSNGGGVLIKPTATGSATVAIANSRIDRNVFGIKVEATSANAVRAVITDTSTNQNAFSGLTVNGALGSAQIFTDRVTSAHNGTTGLQANGTAGVLRAANTTVYNNATGLQTSASGQMISNSGNHVRGNAIDGVFTGTEASQ